MVAALKGGRAQITDKWFVADVIGVLCLPMPAQLIGASTLDAAVQAGESTLFGMVLAVLGEEAAM